MNISVNTRWIVSTLIIESGNTKVTEDLSEGDEVNEMIDKLITIANELSRFNDISDVTFVSKIHDAFLNDSEREQFLELITEQENEQ